MARLVAQRLLLDSGAVIGLSRNDQRPRAVLASAWEAGIDVYIPSVVLAETIRGKATDAPVHRVIKAVGEIVPADEQDGRLAGSLLGATGSKSTIDAIIVATAIRLGGVVILTGDSEDLSTLAAGQPVRVESF
ncbi:MAG: type II toxin-antitoxin system VapC family toxin [Acidimicrobiales bacterium]